VHFLNFDLTPEPKVWLDRETNMTIVIRKLSSPRISKKWPKIIKKVFDLLAYFLNSNSPPWPYGRSDRKKNLTMVITTLGLSRKAKKISKYAEKVFKPISHFVKLKLSSRSQRKVESNKKHPHRPQHIRFTQKLSKNLFFFTFSILNLFNPKSAFS
jgi:hypothetical protein